MRRLLVALVAVTSLSASAQAVYTWEDADGLHFTDDPAQVPPRAKVKVLAPSAPANPGPAPATSPSSPVPRAPSEAAAEVTPAEVNSVEAPLPNPAPAPAAAPSAPSAPSAPTASAESDPDREEPLDERAWRASFIAAQRRVETLRDRAATLERSRASRADCVPEPLTAAEVSAPGGSTTRCRSSSTQERLQARLAELRGELKEAELELEALDREASRRSVPREWRRGW